MEKHIITYYEITNPTTDCTIANGYALGQRWFNSDTGAEFLHKSDGNWLLHIPSQIASDSAVASMTTTGLNVVKNASITYTQTFDGGTLDDAVFSGDYTEKKTLPTYGNTNVIYLSIDSVGSIDTFGYTDLDGIMGNSNIEITGTIQLLEYGIYVKFDNITGHAIGDAWSYTIIYEASYKPNILVIGDDCVDGLIVSLGGYSSNLLGENAGRNTSNTSYSNFFGSRAGDGATNATNSNFFGQAAGVYSTNGSFSNFFGYHTGLGASNASYSNHFGYHTGYNSGGNTNSIGENNIIIGTNISLPRNSTNMMNLGGVLFGTGFYFDSGSTQNFGVTSGGKIGILTTTPNSTLQVSGTLSLPYIEKTGSYTLTDTDYTVNCTSNTFNVTLPTAVGCIGRLYNIKNTGLGTITVLPSGSQTIDGETYQRLVKPTNMQVQSTNSNWIIL